MHAHAQALSSAGKIKYYGCKMSLSLDSAFIDRALSALAVIRVFSYRSRVYLLTTLGSIVYSLFCTVTIKASEFQSNAVIITGIQEVATGAAQWPDRSNTIIEVSEFLKNMSTKVTWRNTVVPHHLNASR